MLKRDPFLVLSCAKPSMAPRYPGEKGPVATAGKEGRSELGLSIYMSLLQVLLSLLVLLLVTPLISPLMFVCFHATYLCHLLLFVPE